MNKYLEMSFNEFEAKMNYEIIKANLKSKNHYELKEEIVKIMRKELNRTGVFVNNKRGRISIVISTGKKYDRSYYVYIPFNLETHDQKMSNNSYARVYTEGSLNLSLNVFKDIYFLKGLKISNFKDLLEAVDNAPYYKTPELDIIKTLKKLKINYEDYKKILEETEEAKKINKNWLQNIKRSLD